MERNEFVYEGWALRQVSEDLKFSKFDCGDTAMNVYFRRKSKKFRRQLLVKSYHFCPREYTGNEPIMLVDLCNDVIRRDVIPQVSKGKIEKQKLFLETFPAVKIARLARNKIFAGNQMSVHLFNALKLFFLQNNRTGCRFLTLDAYPQRVPLYELCGFQKTLADEDISDESENVSMFFDLITLNV